MKQHENQTRKVKATEHMILLMQTQTFKGI